MTVERLEGVTAAQVEVVEGDILQPGCGISETDKKKLASCSVVVHAAASVCFTSPVGASLLHNYHVSGHLHICTYDQYFAFLNAILCFDFGVLHPIQR